MENVNLGLEMPAEVAEEIKRTVVMYSEHRRERMTDDIAIYDRLMQGIEELGERCEAFETTEDPEEKRRGLRVYSENLRTISALVQARTNHLRMMDEHERKMFM